MLSFLKMYKKYFDFNGRITRKEFWMNIAIYHFLNLLILFFDRLIIPKYTNIATSFYIIFFLFSLTPIINLTDRRLHDINKNGWWTILYCLPFLNLWLIFLPSLYPSKRYQRLYIWMFHNLKISVAYVGKFVCLIQENHI